MQKACSIRFFIIQKAKNHQNLTSESKSKDGFSLLHKKVVNQAVCLRTQAVGIKARF